MRRRQREQPRRAAPLPVLPFQRWRRQESSCGTDSLCDCQCCTRSDLLSVCLPPPSRRSAYLHVPHPPAPNVRAEAKSVYLFWRRLRTRVSLRRSAPLALRSVCFERRGASAAEKQTSKNICSPLLEDEQCQSYIYPDAVMRNCFHMGARMFQYSCRLSKANAVQLWK